MTDKKTTTDAVEIFKRRYVNTPERAASLEQEREIASLEVAIYDLVEDLRKIVEAFGEFDPELDETCCPMAFVECRCCGGSGMISGRGHKKHPPTHKEDCAWKRIIDLVKKEADEDT